MNPRRLSWSRHGGSREPTESSTAEPAWTAKLYWALLTVVAAIEIAPLYLVRYLPLVDLPNHEARIDILAHYGSNPVMQRFYVVDWRPIPDLAFDLFAVPLVRLGMSPVAAGRLFLAIAALLYVIGGHLLAQAAAGRRSWLGVVLPLLFYSSMLFYGFINFVFGFGVFLVAFALWLRWRAEMTYLRTGLLAGLLVAAFLCPPRGFRLVGACDRRHARRSTGRSDGRRAPPAFVPSWRFSRPSSCSSTAARPAGAAAGWPGDRCRGR